MVDEKKLQEVYKYIDDHKDSIIQELIDVCSIKSVSDAKSDVKPFGQGCLDALACMFKKGEANGFETRSYDDYVGCITYNTGAKDEDSIGVWAHLDVVPEGEGWMSDPYKPEIRDGYLFGRGVGDDKSGAIGTLYIQKALRAANWPMKHNLKLYLGTAEETGMADVEYYVEHYPVPKFSLVPDAGFPGGRGEFGRVQYELVSEKTVSDDIIDLYAGTVFNIIPNKATIVLSKDTKVNYKDLPAEFEVVEVPEGIKITGFGVAGHAAGPERAVNAVKVLTSELVKLDGWKDADKELLTFVDNVNMDPYGTYLDFPLTDYEGQTVSSGTVLRLRDRHIKLTNDCRHAVTDSTQRIISQIEKNAKKDGYNLEILLTSNPYHIPADDPKILAIQKVCKEYAGIERELGVGKGGTYAGKIPNAVATGIVLRDWDAPKPEGLLPGHGGAHQPDEFIPVDAFIDGIKLLATIIVNLDDVM